MMDATANNKLRKIVAMMDSENDGERANAARAFYKIVTTNGNEIGKLNVSFADGTAHATQTFWRRQSDQSEHDANMLRYELEVLRAFVSDHVVKLAKREARRMERGHPLRKETPDITGAPSWTNRK